MSGAELHVVHPARDLISGGRGLGLATAVLLLTAGCYTYRPLSAPVPAAGTHVQVTLTGEGADSIANRVGPNVRTVLGDVVRADSAGLTLAVQAVENRRGDRDGWQGERLDIPLRFVGRLQERRLAVGGTGLLGGAVAAGLFALTRAFGGGTIEGTAGAVGAPAQ
jgi:hypothetical protein